jgi:predicted DNA-binding transcriptional regulator YafY
MSLATDAEAFLFLVPFVASRPEGVPIAELLEHLSLDRSELAALLDRVSAVGRPDGGPDEMVEVYVEGGRVHVALPQSFRSPPRFSVEEALALLLVLAPLRESALPELSRHASELTETLLSISSQRAKALSSTLREAITVLPSEAERPEHLGLLERAIAERRAVTVEYYTASRDALGTRELRPWALFPHRGAWYVITDERKTYKVARMRQMSLTERVFPAPSEEDLAPYRAQDPFGARCEPDPIEVELEGPDGAIRFRGPVTPSTQGFLRAHRGRFVLVAPDADRATLIDQTKALLERYESAPRRS